MFPFNRFPGIDPVLSPEMKSTGEVMGIDADFAHRLRQGAARRGDGAARGRRGVRQRQGRRQAARSCRRCARWSSAGFTIVATGGTADYLAQRGLPVERVNKVAQGRPHIVDRIKDGEIALIFNTTEGWQSLKDSQPIRASALNGRVPYFTTASAQRRGGAGDRGSRRDP